MFGIPLTLYVFESCYKTRRYRNEFDTTDNTAISRVYYSMLVDVKELSFFTDILVVLSSFSNQENAKHTLNTE